MRRVFSITPEIEKVYSYAFPKQNRECSFGLLNTKGKDEFVLLWLLFIIFTLVFFIPRI